MSRYTADFGEEGAHGHCRDLLARSQLAGGVVLDLGCAAGPLAEPVAELGFDYVGADIDQAAVDQLAGRGFEAHLLDLRGDDGELDAALAGIVGDRPVAAVLLVDVIEHLVDPGPTLRAIARLGSPEHRPRLVVSIPNVSHVDLGAKLLAGRWDVTKIGLLDDTHLRFYTAARVAETMGAAGWREVDAFDVVNPFSDQQFPEDAPVLRAGTPLRHLLARVRANADQYDETYQFVRAFEQSPAPAGQPDLGADAGGSEVPFLSVVVRVSGAKDGRAAILRDLAGQTLPDLEVLLSHADGADGADQAAVADGAALTVRDLKPEPDWRNAAIAAAEGRYLAFVDDRTRLAPEFVATIRRIADEMPSRVVQVGAHLVDHPRPGDAERSYGEVIEGLPPVDLDPLDLVSMLPFGSVAVAAHAVPREVCATTGVRFPPELRPGSATLFLLRCVELCGIARTSEPLSAVEAAAVRPVADDLGYLKEELAADAVVIPPGAASYMLHMREALADAVAQRDEYAARLAATSEQLGALSALLVQRDEELARGGSQPRRDDDDGGVGTRLRRQVGRVVRKI